MTSGQRRTFGLVVVVLGVLLLETVSPSATTVSLAQAPPGQAPPDQVDIFLPVCLDAAPKTAFAPLPRETATPTATETIAIPPTKTPLPTATPTATEPPVASRIHGLLLSGGEPLPDYGVPGGPQIELRVCRSVEDGCVGDEWEAIDHVVSGKDGRFEFMNPPALAEGEAYQVWWVNDFEHVDQATMDFLGRWFSRPIESFGPGDEVDVGRFEVENLLLREPCHDCGHSLPKDFRWDRRPNRNEEYHWSLFKRCGFTAPRYTAYRTESLGHKGVYELLSPPPGFRLDVKYCWYVFIDDGPNGTGWTFEEYRITFLSVP